MGSSSADRAVFATTARLLSCLVTESLVRAIFAPLQWSDCVGIGVVLNAPVKTVPTHNCKYYSQGDVLAIVLLRHVPVFRTDSSDLRGKEIGLLDPLDMFPLVMVTSGYGDLCDHKVRLMSFYYGFGFRSEPRCAQLHQGDMFSAIRRVLSLPCWAFPETTIIKELNDPLVLWDAFATSIDLDPATRSDISEELASSMRWQTYSYDHPPNAPTLLSHSVDWEQSIVEGHPTHPVCGSSVLLTR